MAKPTSLPAGLKKYRVSSRFGPRALAGSTNHLGCDWATPVGVPLEAIISGTVSAVGGSLTHGWGYYVHVKDGTDEVEYHILRDKPTFKLGQRVTRGHIIGYTGRSGALRGKRYDPHHHLGVKAGGWYYDPLSIGWPEAADTASKPFEEEDEMNADQNAKLEAIWNWVRGPGTDAEGTMLYQIQRDTQETVKGIRDLNVPDTRNRIGNIQHALGLLLARDGNTTNVAAGLSDEDLKAIAKTVNDEEDRRERERLGK